MGGVWRCVEGGWKSGGENGELCCVHSIFHPFEELQYIRKCVPGFLLASFPGSLLKNRGRREPGNFLHGCSQALSSHHF